MTDVVPGSFAAWRLAIRPKTLPAALAPVIVGTAIAFREGGLHWGAAFAAAVGALLLQITSNLANDVFDFEQGKDTKERLGPVRVVQANLLTAQEVRTGLGVVMALSLLVGSYLVGKAGWPLVIVGLASIAAALAYTAGPYPLGYHGLGDLFVFIFFGPVAVIGTVYVQCEELSQQALWASIPVGLLTTNILVVNNLRDRVEDARTGKRTLVVRFGKHFAMSQALANLAVSALCTLYFCWLTRRPWPLILPALTLPAAFRWYRELRRTEGVAMNELLARAARLLFVFSLLFSLSLVLSP
jgi:1,4-dihydroxy-2-naphthoate octaprenyltransferase